MMLVRAKQFNEYISTATSDAKPDEHVVIVAHGMLLSALTCEGVKQDENGHDTYLAQGLIKPETSVQTNARPTLFNFDQKEGKWILAEKRVKFGYNKETDEWEEFDDEVEPLNQEEKKGW